MNFIIEEKTPTINHLYGQFHGRKFLKKEAKELRDRIILMVQNEYPKAELEMFKSNKLRVNVEIHEDWYNKNGSVKRKDLNNREKFLIDSVFQALELDDSYIFEYSTKKVQSSDEKAIIEIYMLY